MAETIEYRFDSPKPRVLDKTGLTRTYDFTLRFSCEACQFAVTNGSVALPAASTDSTSASGFSNLFLALPKQLGLKLVKVKDITLDGSSSIMWTRPLHRTDFLEFCRTARSSKIDSFN